MTYYIIHDTTAMYWNDDAKIWQPELTVVCTFEDYDAALKAVVINDLSNYTIKQWF